MGEAFYYLKLQFETNDSAKEILPILQEFFKEGVDSYFFWQRNRKMEDDGRRKAFWKRFKLKFPLVCEYLGDLVEGNCHGMVGLLDFGDSERDVDNDMQVHQNEIWYNAWIWHCANWEPLINFLKYKFKALKGGWVSEKFFEPIEDFELQHNYCFDRVKMS